MFYTIGGSNHWSAEAEKRFLLNKIPRELLFSPRKSLQLVNDSSLNDLINRLVVADPKARLSMFDVLRHPYFAYSEVPFALTCQERLDNNSIEVTIPGDYYKFAEIIDRNQLVPYDGMFSGCIATAMQLFCRFRKKQGGIDLLHLAIPLVYLAADINTFSHQEINADWFDAELDDVDEDLFVDLYQSPEEIIRIQRVVMETLDYDLWFTTDMDRARLRGDDLAETRDSLMTG